MGLLALALVFLLIAFIAGALGLTNVALISADIARLLFTVFFIIFILILIAWAVVII